MMRSAWLICLTCVALILLLALSAMSQPIPARAQDGGPWQAYLPAAFLALPTPTPTETPTAEPTETPAPTPTGTSTPTPTDTPSGDGLPPIVWDARLTQRYAVLVPAEVEPGKGYWRVVKGQWYDVNDFHPMGVGDHEIHYDVQDAAGLRQVGKSLKISWTTDGSCETGRVLAEGLAPELANVLCAVTVQTQPKTGEIYAGAWGMSHVAPTYKIIVDDGNPSEAVDGLGMGSIEQPGMKIHTASGFIWRWTIAPIVHTPTPTATPSPTDPNAPPPTPTNTRTPTRTPLPAPNREWDPRLDQRGLLLREAEVQAGQGYWRLIAARWYDVNEAPFAGLGLILVDTRTQDGSRQTGVQIQIASLAGAPLYSFTTESKPGELYAGNTVMGQAAPAYQARPLPLSVPADSVWGLGLGSLTDPNPRAATRYGLVWRWTIAGGAGATPTPTPTATPSPTPGTYLFNTAVLASCRSQAAGTWFDGTVRLHGQPVDGYRVTFAAAPDGPWISEVPAVTGPTPIKPWDPHGHYAHIIRPAASGSPIAGDWYVWIVDSSGRRISTIATWHSSGRVPVGEGCNDATVNFDS